MGGLQVGKCHIVVLHGRPRSCEANHCLALTATAPQVQDVRVTKTPNSPGNFKVRVTCVDHGTTTEGTMRQAQLQTLDIGLNNIGDTAAQESRSIDEA